MQKKEMLCVIYKKERKKTGKIYSLTENLCKPIQALKKQDLYFHNV